MQVELNADELSVLGAEMAAIGDVIAVIVAERQITEEDSMEVANLAVIANSFTLIGDTLTLKSILIDNQESDEEPSEMEESEKLDNIAARLDVVSDIIALQASLLERQEIVNKPITFE